MGRAGRFASIVNRAPRSRCLSLTPLVGSMPDFLAAARRHLDDGDFLCQQSRIPNAVQLWAYGAECTLKALAFKQNLFAIDSQGKPNNKFGQHLNQTSKSEPPVPDLLSLYNATQTGMSPLLGPTTAFVGWDINARYEDGSQLQPCIAQYALDARCFRQLLTKSMLPEGL